MYNCDELRSFLGYSVNDDHLVEHLSMLGIDVSSEVWLDEGEFTAYLERKLSGICLLFTDEAMFLGHEQQPLGVGPLYISGFFLYAEGEDGYRKFDGQLPEGLDFSDTELTVREKLGRPGEFRSLREDGTTLRERWDEENYSVAVTLNRHQYCRHS